MYSTVDLTFEIDRIPWEFTAGKTSNNIAFILSFTRYQSLQLHSHQLLQFSLKLASLGLLILLNYPNCRILCTFLESKVPYKFIWRELHIWMIRYFSLKTFPSQYLSLSCFNGPVEGFLDLLVTTDTFISIMIFDINPHSKSG